MLFFYINRILFLEYMHNILFSVIIFLFDSIYMHFVEVSPIFELGTILGHKHLS